MTKNCNYQCRHCYLSAGPGLQNTTISEEDFQKAIGNLPKVSLRLTLTGGEVFTVRDQLYNFLGIVQEENTCRQSKKEEPILVEVQTNGYWATTVQRTKKILSKLQSLDVDKLDVSSLSDYHQEQGVNLDNLYRLKELAVEGSYLKEIELRGDNLSKRNIFPIGRAQKMNLDLSRLNIGDISCKYSLNDLILIINENGQVSNCCWSMVPSLGNLIEEPLVDIVRRARKNPRLKLLNDKGIRGIARKDGWKKKDLDKLIKKHGECGFCYRKYRDTLL